MAQRDSGCKHAMTRSRNLFSRGALSLRGNFASPCLKPPALHGYTPRRLAHVTKLAPPRPIPFGTPHRSELPCGDRHAGKTRHVKGAHSEESSSASAFQRHRGCMQPPSVGRPLCADRCSSSGHGARAIPIERAPQNCPCHRAFPTGFSDLRLVRIRAGLQIRPKVTDPGPGRPGTDVGRRNDGSLLRRHLGPSG